MRLHLAAILTRGVIGRDLHVLLRFQIDQHHRFIERGRDFLRIENVEQHHLVAVEAQWLDRAHDRLRLLVEV
jgi:hypothetical protein